jgi:hypothetical protein
MPNTERVDRAPGRALQLEMGSRIFHAKADKTAKASQGSLGRTAGFNGARFGWVRFGWAQRGFRVGRGDGSMPRTGRYDRVGSGLFFPGVFGVGVFGAFTVV